MESKFLHEMTSRADLVRETVSILTAINDGSLTVDTGRDHMRTLRQRSESLGVDWNGVKLSACGEMAR